MTSRARVRWAPPVPQARFRVTQPYLAEDRRLYPQFGRHPGVDYAGGAAGIPLYAVAAGEIAYAAGEGTSLGRFLGNHCALYVLAADRSFLYCHLAGEPPAVGSHLAHGETLGEMGDTGEAEGIHLHLEGYYGRFTLEMRHFSSLADLEQRTFDPDAYLRAKLAT